jgi:hypothetical protein
MDDTICGFGQCPSRSISAWPKSARQDTSPSALAGTIANGTSTIALAKVGAGTLSLTGTRTLRSLLRRNGQRFGDLTQATSIATAM